MAEGDYKSGYGKPPMGTRYQPGQSGNPGGKRKRPLSLAEEIAKHLNRRVAVPMKGGKKKLMRVAEIIASKTVQLGADSDLAAIKLILEIEAKQAQEALKKAPTPAVEPEPIIEFTLMLDDEEARQRILDNQVSARLVELGYPPDPRLEQRRRDALDS